MLYTDKLKYLYNFSKLLLFLSPSQVTLGPDDNAEMPYKAASN